MRDIILDPQVEEFLLDDDGLIPNNLQLPLLVYEHVLNLPQHQAAAVCEAVIGSNHWGGGWRNGIYAFHHYHSTAHEVLVIASGTVRVQFGGEYGPTLVVSAGDVVIIPAGVGHKNLGASRDLLVVGAYPPGQIWDLCRGTKDERPWALENIRRVPLPCTDPIFGRQGPLIDRWLRQNAVPYGF